jgi:hypothetical protein
MDLFKQAPSERRPLSPIDLDGTDLRGVEVKREWKHTDLLIRCQEPPFAVVIENKIGAKEGTEQLNRYKDMVEKHYPGALYVYLTLNADEPSEDAWVPYSYEDIHRVLKRVRETHRKAIGREVLVFLDHYLNLIGTRFMNDKEIDELCQRIYKNHRQALDLIWERVGGPTSRVLSEAAAVVEEDPRWEVVARPSNCIDFVPKGWWEWLPRLALRGDPRSWIYVHLASYKGRLFIAVEMAPMTDLVKRKEIATRLLDESPAFGFTRPKTREVKNNYSRISASERILEWSEDEELEPDKIRNAVMKALDNLLPKVEKLALVLKPLCKLTASTT